MGRCLHAQVDLTHVGLRQLPFVFFSTEDAALSNSIAAGFHLPFARWHSLLGRPVPAEVFGLPYGNWTCKVP